MITLLLLVRATYIYGVVLHAHPVRGESHNQRNTTREVATLYNVYVRLSMFVIRFSKSCSRNKKKQFFGFGWDFLEVTLQRGHVLEMLATFGRPWDPTH